MWPKPSITGTWIVTDGPGSFEKCNNYYKGSSRYVFNIKGNQYRVVAVILFQIQIAYIRFVGTHGQYDRINCKEI